MMDSETQFNAKALKAYLELYDKFLDDKEFAQSSHKMSDLALASYDAVAELKGAMKHIYAIATEGIEQLVETSGKAIDEANGLADMQIRLTEIGANLDHKIETYEENQRNGARKNKEPREKAIKWIKTELEEQPDISINSLAAILESVSENAPAKFGKIIKLSTAKDYIRAVKRSI
jgi:hypothetical protein